MLVHFETMATETRWILMDLELMELNRSFSFPEFTVMQMSEEMVCAMVAKKEKPEMRQSQDDQSQICDAAMCN